MKYWAVLILLQLSIKAIASGTGIIGIDNRTLVASGNRFQKPFSMVGRLSYNYTGRTGSCTASLIAPNLILTNAHCVFTAGASGKGYAHSNFKFSPQYVKGGTNLEIPATWLETDLTLLALK